MLFHNLVTSTPKVIAVAAATLAVAFAGSAAAYAERDAVGPSVTVTPSTGLNDGQTVTVRVREFAEDAETVQVVQCARVLSGKLVCNNPDSIRLITDLGTASGALVVRRAFTGYNQDGTVWGPVNCNTASGGCFVFAQTLPPGVKATAPISFQ